jgi:hypothetical protein
VNPVAGAGAILGFPRSTYIESPFGHTRVAKTTVDGGPANTVTSLVMETGLPIEGYLLTGMGSFLPGAPKGFSDLVDAFGGFPFLVPYEPMGGIPAMGDTFLNGTEAIAWARERQNSPYGGVNRTLNQGMMMKSAVATVQPLGMAQIPNLLSIMDGFVGTNLSIGQILTLAATIYTVNPGPMPTATPQDFVDFGHVLGRQPSHRTGSPRTTRTRAPCRTRSSRGACTRITVSTFGYDLQSQHQATFDAAVEAAFKAVWADLQDGVLSSRPVDLRRTRS